ncbi:MAG: hypothetical protein KGH55_03640, partial [Nanoarchaeota archaeon]|nr:hypothetical protein [Nanoarchaeota archaeon]
FTNDVAKDKAKKAFYKVESLQNIFNSQSQTKTLSNANLPAGDLIAKMEGEDKSHPIEHYARDNSANIGDSPKIPDDGDTISKTALGESPDAQEGEK